MPHTRHSQRTSRAVGICLVVLLHVVVVYALVNGLAHREIDVRQGPIETKIIEDVKVENTKVPLPSPPLPLPPPPLPFVALPEIRIDRPVPENRIDRPVPAQMAKNLPITNAMPAEAPPAPLPPKSEPVKVEPKLDLSHSHEPEYPPISRRLGEEGTVLLQVLIDPEGRAVDVRVARSSGFARLDTAAVEGVREAYHFTPGTTDGKPDSMWLTFKITWNLR